MSRVLGLLLASTGQGIVFKLACWMTHQGLLRSTTPVDVLALREAPVPCRPILRISETLREGCRGGDGIE